MQKLTRLLSSRLYKVEYELYPDTKYRLIEETPNTAISGNRYSSHFNTNTASINTPNINTVTTNANQNVRSASGGSNRNKARSRHLSMQGNPRLRRGSFSTRPSSAIEGKLTNASEDVMIGDINESPAPEGSVSTLLRNLSSASLSDIANTFKTDRKSTHLTSVVDEEEEESEPRNTKFSIKKPTSGPSSASMGKRSNTNNSGSSIGASEARRAISIQQLDTLWQDSGSKLLNFVQQHHGNDPQSSASKGTVQQEAEKKSVLDWDHASASSIDEISTKVSLRLDYAIKMLII
jgi:hypothetical protein